MAKRDIIKRVELRFYDGDEALVEWLESQGSNVTAAIKRAIYNEMNGVGGSVGADIDYSRIRAIVADEVSRVSVSKAETPKKTISKEQQTLFSNFKSYDT